MVTPLISGAAEKKGEERRSVSTVKSGPRRKGFASKSVSSLFKKRRREGANPIGLSTSSSETGGRGGREKFVRSRPYVIFLTTVLEKKKRGEGEALLFEKRKGGEGAGNRARAAPFTMVSREERGGKGGQFFSSRRRRVGRTWTGKMACRSFTVQCLKEGGGRRASRTKGNRTYGEEDTSPARWASQRGRERGRRTSSSRLL